MSGYLTGRIEPPKAIGLSTILTPQPVVLLLLLLALAPASILGAAPAAAQSVGPDEAFNGRGAAAPELALSEEQQSVIYRAVLHQRARGPAVAPGSITAVVGAPVSPAVELAALPGVAADAAPLAADLKYAMVEDDLVVVDPVRMRVVDVIHGASRP